MGERETTEPLTDFGDDEARRKMAYAIADNAENLGLDHPLWIGGKRVTLPGTVETRDPSDPEQIVSIFPAAGAAQVTTAVDSALRGGAEWREHGPEERARVLRDAADSLRPRRFELLSWTCFEAGLTWAEADADFALAVGLLARAADAADGGTAPREPLAFAAGDGAPLASLAAVLGPWLARGGAAAVRAGPQAPLVQWRFVEALLDAGLPGEALQFLVGAGTDGPLAFDDRVAGAQLGEADAVPEPLRGSWRASPLARAKLIVVLEEAEADAAAAWVVRSACACAGRHPAGGGRVLAVGVAHDALAERVAAHARERTVGPAIDLTTGMGPLPDAARFDAWRRGLEGAAPAPREKGELPEPARARRTGFFVGPWVWSDLAADDDLWRAPPPGPAIAIARAADLDEALGVRAGLGPCRTVLCGATPAEAERVRAAHPDDDLRLDEPGLAFGLA